VRRGEEARSFTCIMAVRIIMEPWVYMVGSEYDIDYDTYQNIRLEGSYSSYENFASPITPRARDINVGKSMGIDCGWR
jgi:hypothetical protein